MGKKTAVFTEGQHVFAKVKGYSPWPAKITRVIAKHKYAVYFYGTGETASVKSEDLDPYDERNCSRFNTERQLKKSDYKEAVDQIQAALTGNDPAPIITDDKIKFEQTPITDEDNSADESQLLIAENAKPPQMQKKKITVVKTKADFSPLELAKAKENDEKVSRSGRKIKEKKMNNDEMDPDEMFTQSRKRFKIDESKVSLVGENQAIDDFRASKMHILQDPVKKSMLDTQYEMIHNVQDIKLSLGLEKADIDRSIDLLESLKAKILPNITKVMLLKYPNTVETIKRLRKYIGNFHLWKMEETQIEQFHEKSEAIRTTASFIYDQFRNLFAYPDGSSFWGKFAEEQKHFQEKYNALSSADLFEGLDHDELDLLMSNRLAHDEKQLSEIESDVQKLSNEDTVETGNNETSEETSQL